jgi:hypothetical protein
MDACGGRGRSSYREWRRHELVEAVLDEFVWRHLDAMEERDLELLRVDAMLPPK